MEKPKKKYPMISVRVKQYQLDFVRREARGKGLSVANYVRAVLMPFDRSTVKEMLTM